MAMATAGGIEWSAIVPICNHFSELNNTHSYSSGQCRILDVLHVDLALLVQQTGQREHGGGAGAQGQIGVEDGAVLAVVGGRQGGVERGPAHPQEQRAHHREQVRVVDGCGRVEVVEL